MTREDYLREAGRHQANSEARASDVKRMREAMAGRAPTAEDGQALADAELEWGGSWAGEGREACWVG